MADETTNEPQVPAEPPKPVAARYAKPGEFFSGIPARDLNVDEWDALTPEQRELCLSSGLYKAIGGLVKPAKKEK